MSADFWHGLLVGFLSSLLVLFVMVWWIGGKSVRGERETPEIDPLEPLPQAPPPRHDRVNPQLARELQIQEIARHLIERKGLIPHAALSHAETFVETCEKRLADLQPAKEPTP